MIRSFLILFFIFEGVFNGLYIIGNRNLELLHIPLQADVFQGASLEPLRRFHSCRFTFVAQQTAPAGPQVPRLIP